MIDERARLIDLHEDFLATSTVSLPIAGALFWTVAAVAGLLLEPHIFAYALLFGTGAIFPLGILIDRLRGRNFMAAGRANPLTGLFMRSIGMMALMFPLVIIAAARAGDPTILVLGAAILTGIIWIPYGWAAADPAGLKHAVGRSLFCYAAFLFVPEPTRGSAICAVVVLSYFYSFAFMRRPPSQA